MRKEWLETRLEAGRSHEDIAREIGCHASTIGYWVAKHGLVSPHAARFAPRGPPGHDELGRMAAEGATLREMAESLDRSIATIRHWLARWDLPRGPRPGRRPVHPESAPRTTRMACTRHGETDFCLEGRGAYRCRRCRQEQVAEWRRRTKRTLVAEAGGRCRCCGYDRCRGA